jgi:hypothetical protein
MFWAYTTILFDLLIFFPQISIRILGDNKNKIIRPPQFLLASGDWATAKLHPC